MNRLEIEQAFQVAIDRELEANRFYTEVANKVSDPNVREVFRDLAEQEMGHYELIEKLRTDPTLDMKFAAPEGDWKMAEAEDTPALSVNMKPRDAVAMAMKKEQRAAEFYGRLSDRATDAGIRAIFKNLAAMELGHKRRLEEVFVDVGYPEAF